MKTKTPTGISMSNKKTTPPTAGKISRPKNFKAKLKTPSVKSPAVTQSTTPTDNKKELSVKKRGNKRNKKISPELNLGLKIEKILQSGGPNVIRLSSESETPKSSNFQKKVKSNKKEVKSDSNENEMSGNSELTTPKPKRKKKESAGKSNQIKKNLNTVENIKGTFKSEHGETGKNTSVPDTAKQCNLEFDKALNAVNNLKQYLAKRREKLQNTELFEEDTEPVFLQVTCLKKAMCPKRLLRFSLPHPIVHELSDICLLVPDKRGDKINPDAAVEYYQELLDKNNMTNIKQIIPLRTLRQEYSQYEMRRKLFHRFDVFLADSRISHYLVKLLGRDFAYTKKHPIPVRLASGNLKTNIEKALTKTHLKIGPNADTFVIVVGHGKQSAEEIAANIHTVAKGLAEYFPGNWPNVRSLYVKTERSLALPVYISLLPPNSVKVPVMKAKKKKGDEIVEGELSTLLDATVRVKPDGTVLVQRSRKRRSSLSDDEVDEQILEEVRKNKEESKSAGTDNVEKAKRKNKSDKILKRAEENFVTRYKGNLEDVDDDVDDGVENDNEDDILDDDVGDDDNAQHEVNTNAKKRKSTDPTTVQKKKAKNSPPQDEDDNEDDKPKVMKNKSKGEKTAKTNWIKSTKKGPKKLSKSQRKAQIKTKKLQKTLE